MGKKKLVVLSGAGVSAESGLSTFRDSDGLWDKYDQWNEEGRPMTKTLAEAALLFAYMNHDETRLADILDRIGGADSRILKRFNSFSAAANRGSDESFFKKNYGDTYWYHCFFMKELLTD